MGFAQRGICGRILFGQLWLFSWPFLRCCFALPSVRNVQAVNVVFFFPLCVVNPLLWHLFNHWRFLILVCHCCSYLLVSLLRFHKADTHPLKKWQRQSQRQWEKHQRNKQNEDERDWKRESERGKKLEIMRKSLKVWERERPFLFFSRSITLRLCFGSLNQFSPGFNQFILSHV